MRELIVDTARASYPIRIVRAAASGTVARFLRNRRAIALVDRNVERLQAARLDALLPGILRWPVPEGEAAKSLPHYGDFAERLLSEKLGRDDVLVAVGGGVTGDLCGFLAATYMRGIPFIQIPTTLLAQVDASIGGKVAVNLPGARNALGCFHQPAAVLIDPDFLTTLPERQMRTGLAEMVKMAACLDANLLTSLEAAGRQLLRADHSDWPDLIAAACELKRRIVAEDEREFGARKVLNFGHTLGHAIEGYEPRPDFTHGEAVSVGMVFAMVLGERMLKTDVEHRLRLTALLDDIGLPVRLPDALETHGLRKVMDTDKKSRGGAPRFVLLRDWGRAVLDVAATEEDILASLEAIGAEDTA